MCGVSMKKITIVLDGVADRPNKELDGMTPLEYAQTPNLDRLARESEIGLVRTIPPGMEVGSAVGNLSMLGFDPAGYRGRSVIEAAGLGLPIDPNDLYIRVNFVNFDGADFDSSSIRSYSAYDVPTEVAAPVAEDLTAAVYGGDNDLRYCGSFRSTLIVKGGRDLYPVDFAPAHDIIGQPVQPYINEMASSEKTAPFLDLMRRSYEHLQSSGTDINGVWFWGASIVPELEADVSGRGALSETLLMDGITTILGLPNENTVREGRSYEDFLEEKLEKAIRAAGEYDNLYVHLQETDDLSHELQPLKKAQAIEAFDRVFLPRFLESLTGDYTITIAGDHYTFSDTGAHGGDPVPYLYYDSRENLGNGAHRLTEQEGESTGVYFEAKDLMQRP